MSDTSELWSALSSPGPLIALLESILHFFLVCLSLFQVCPSLYIRALIISVLNILNRLRFTIISVWMAEKGMHQIVVVFNRGCAGSLWLLIWYFPGIIVTSEYVSAHKSDPKWKVCMPKVHR